MAGISDLDAALEGLAAQLAGPAMEGLVREALMPTAELARAQVAVRTGEVRDAITVTGRHSRTRATGAVEVLGSGPGGPAREALYLELGTSRMAAEPFLRLALAATQCDIVNHIAGGIASAIKTHG